MPARPGSARPWRIALNSDLPIFPLHAVLVPGGFLPLQIFEPRYLDLVRDCARDDSGFGVNLVYDTDSGPNQHSRIGTVARIRDFNTLANGLLGITVEGQGRYAIDTTRMRDNGLMIASVTSLAEPPYQALPTEFDILARVLERFMEQFERHYPGYSRERLDDAAWVGYRLTELLPLELPEKQFLLETEEPLQRLQLLLETLPRFQVSGADE